MAQLNNGWVDWAVECLVQGHTKDRLIPVMVNYGFTTEEADSFLSNVHKLPIYRIYKNLWQKHRKLESVINNTKALYEQDPFFDRVPRTKTPSNRDFFKDYWLRNQPVIFTDYGSDWPAMSKWTFDSFKKNFGNVETEIQSGRSTDPNYEINGYQHKHKVRLSEFIDKILSVEESNDFYMTANNHSFETVLTELLKDTGTIPQFMNSELPHMGFWHLWMGPKGTVTPTHHDTCSLIHLQIVGRKKWWLVHPMDISSIYNHHHVYSQVDLENIDYERFPLMKRVCAREIIVEPGEALFLPAGWWHAVKSLSPSISISMTDFVHPNNWECPSYEVAA